MSDLLLQPAHAVNRTVFCEFCLESATLAVGVALQNFKGPNGAIIPPNGVNQDVKRPALRVRNAVKRPSMSPAASRVRQIGDRPGKERHVSVRPRSGKRIQSGENQLIRAMITDYFDGTAEPLLE